MIKSASTDRQPAPRTQDAVELAVIARRLRRRVISLVAPSGQGYVQQGLGAADLFAVLYFSELRIDPADPRWQDRDRFLLSTAHNTAIFYGTLAERGCLPEEGLASYCHDGSAFEINASERLGPVIEATCGSLGQGLSVGIGMALANRRHGRASRVHILLGDGELQEGQVWEAALAAGSHGLSNLCVTIDWNAMQVGGHIDGVVKMEPIVAKWESFGFHVIDVDGHDIPALLAAYETARRQRERPTCIVARTLVGKGVPSLEGIMSHNLKLPPETARQAMIELGEASAS